jgi:diphthine-ammonia ligase
MKIAKALILKISCLANLHPENTLIEELDSYVYQTVGHTIVPLIADCINLPLIRRPINGSPLQTSSNEYSETLADETEDLFLLLSQVKSQFNITGITVGAIFSDYQRLRVENVCKRLGLQVYAFMWRIPQNKLLNYMLYSGLDAIVIKTATYGLGYPHIGKNLSELKDIFFNLNQKFPDFHICGEGGEYETLIVKCPDIMTSEIEYTLNDSKNEGDVWYADIASTQKVDIADISDKKEDLFINSLNDLSYYYTEFPRIDLQSYPLVSPAEVDHQSFSVSLESEEYDMSLIMNQLTDILSTHDCSLSDLIYTELHLSNINQFSTVNSQYSKYFTTINPPARYCIETNLPGNIKIQAKFTINKSSPIYRLYVQSISTWAMACIGPYSQSVYNKDICMTSGVLGLIPHNMKLVDGGWRSELYFTMRSLKNILLVSGLEYYKRENRCLVYVGEGVEEGDGEVEKEVGRYIDIERYQLEIIRVRKLPRMANIEVRLIYSDEVNDVNS